MMEMEITWTRFSPNGVTFGTAQGRYYKKDRSLANPKIIEIDKHEYFGLSMEM